MRSLKDFWKKKLTLHQTSGLWREHRIRPGPQPMTSFNSNDYLGLSRHPKVIQAFQEAAHLYGVGSGSANTLSGYTKAHDELRQTLREWLGVEEVLLFSSGYQANLAVLTTLVSKKDHVYADKLNHASLNDGMRFSGAKFTRYPHLSLPADLSCAQNWIITESVFSMDGDQADLRSLAEYADRAVIVVDEAHSLGLYGPAGAGLIAEHTLTGKIPLMTGMFGKSLGTQGGFVAGDKVLMDALMQFSRPYLFTTAMAPAIASATTAAIKLVQEADNARAQIRHLINDFRTKAQALGLTLADSHSPIQPIIFDDISLVNHLSHRLNQAGICVSSIRYPTVAMDKPRLRLSLTSNHTPDHISHFFQTLQEVMDEETSHTNRL